MVAHLGKHVPREVTGSCLCFFLDENRSSLGLKSFELDTTRFASYSSTLPLRYISLRAVENLLDILDLIHLVL